MLKQKEQTCWIFCQVIDNFGDIGVTWRLARQLKQEYGMQVCLWVDDLNSFFKICPDIYPNKQEQFIHGVQVCHWDDNFALEEHMALPSIMIEAFACELPLELQEDILKQPQHNLLWLNLEYLSAEYWVEQMHLMVSPQKNGIKKYFYFPGFTQKTGGLLREKNIEIERVKFLQDKPACLNFKQQLGVLAQNLDKRNTVIFLFSYESSVLPLWIEAFCSLNRSLDIWLAPSRNLNSLAYLFERPPQVGDMISIGCVRLFVLPMVEQVVFDRILWLADINIIRGEDSLVRAHWAQKPFFWHIYPQEEKAHLVKLEAFWGKVYQYFSRPVGQAHRQLSEELNGGVLLSEQERLNAWSILFDQLENWCFFNKKWVTKQESNVNLAQQLVSLAKNSLK